MSLLNLHFFELLAMAFVGLFFHWLKKWGRGQTKTGFVEYMQSHRKHTMASVCTVVGSVVTLFASGQGNNELAPYLAFLSGFGLDSMFNKAPGDK